MTKRLTGQYIYVDANVIIYAVEGHEQFGTQARELLSFIENGSATAYTSEFTLAEVLVMPIRRNNQNLVDDYEGLFGGETAISAVPVTRQVLRRAADIRARTGQKMPDCIHAATAHFANCSIIISQDRRLKSDGLMSLALSELCFYP